MISKYWEKNFRKSEARKMGKILDFYKENYTISDYIKVMEIQDMLIFFKLDFLTPFTSIPSTLAEMYIYSLLIRVIILK